MVYPANALPRGDIAAVITRLTRPDLIAPGWWHQAECAGVEPDLFFPARGVNAGPALEVCERCPVRLECLTESIANRERFGIFGGHSDRGRRRIIGAITRTHPELLPANPPAIVFDLPRPTGISDLRTPERRARTARFEVV